ncbi:MAG: tetratricopeptide repeat protein [Hyphomicrobium sp.]
MSDIKLKKVFLVILSTLIGTFFVCEVQAAPKSRQASSKSVFVLAEEGNANAQAKLGQMYQTGNGVPQSYDEAAYWYQSAARQGHPEAQYNLGRLFAMGKGVPQNYFNSYLWLNLAASKNPTERNVRARDQAARYMRPRELAAAQAKSIACVATEYEECSRPRGIRDIFRN